MSEPPKKKAKKSKDAADADDDKGGVSYEERLKVVRDRHVRSSTTGASCLQPRPWTAANTVNTATAASASAQCRCTRANPTSHA